jgi:hypothetical protein
MAITQTHSRMVSDVDAGSTYITGTLGTAASNVVQLTAAAKLPAVDGSLLTNVSTGGGKVLQVVQTSLTAQSNLTSTSLADSGHPAASLTPATTGSKVLINYTGNWGESAAGIETLIVVYRQISSGGYSVLAGTMVGKQSQTGYANLPLAVNFLDSPNTTGQVDYKIYYQVSSGTAYNNYVWSVGAGNPGSNLIITEIGA